MLVVWTMFLCWMDVGFWLYGRGFFVVLTLDFDCLDVGFWLVR